MTEVVPKQECGHTWLLVYKGDTPPLQGPRWPQPSDKPNFCHSVVFIQTTLPLPWHYIPWSRHPQVLPIFLGKVCHLQMLLRLCIPFFLVAQLCSVSACFPASHTPERESSYFSAPHEAGKGLHHRGSRPKVPAYLSTAHGHERASAHLSPCMEIRQVH